MGTYDFDIGVIGGGAAGLTTAAGAARLGAKTLLVEREPALGGDCLHFGCVPSKTLIRSAAVYHRAGDMERFGLPRMERPPVDFSRVAERIRSVIATIQEHDSVERFCRLGVRVVFGEARFKDEHVLVVDGKQYSAGKWVVATGSRPGIPPVRGLDSTSYLTNREIFSLPSLPESLVVLGGGAIALEMAQSFARLGSRVEVIQRSSQILSREDRDMADLVMDGLRREGVVFHLGTRITEVRDLGTSRQVLFTDDNGEEQRVSGEQLLVALGRTSNVDGLGLEGLGIEASARGIAVDARMRTARSHIFAAGDVTGAYRFTHAAGYEGGIVVSNAVFHLPRKADYTWLPRCTYTDPELAGIGLNETQAREQGGQVRVIKERFADNDRAVAHGSTHGMLKLVLGEGDKPLGVQICGPHAGELLNEWVAVFGGGVKLSTLAGAVHPYPTLGEISKRAAGSVIGEKIFSEKVRKTLKFFFNFKGRACGEF